jgi:acetoin utilization deacetylase AcuC-like enzyme
MILAFLAREGLVDRGDVLAPRIASLQDIRRVHSDVYLESLHDLPVLESILGTQIAESQLDEVLDLHRLMVGGTIAAAKPAPVVRYMDSSSSWNPSSNSSRR